MKKLAILLLFTVLFVTSGVKVHANTPSPTATHSALISQELDKKFTDQIASRVAQLKLVEKRGVIGTVSEVSGTQITLTDNTNSLQYIDLDEITKFSSSTNTTFGLSDLTKGTKISVLGLYNKDSQRILARFISPIVLPKIYYGVITSVDNKNYVLYVTTLETANIYTDVQTTTKIYTYANNKIQKVGFSKITQNEPILVIGYPDAKNTAHILPSRILLLPNLPLNPLLQRTLPTMSPTTTPSPIPSKTKK